MAPRNNAGRRAKIGKAGDWAMGKRWVGLHGFFLGGMGSGRKRLGESYVVRTDLDGMIRAVFYVVVAWN